MEAVRDHDLGVPGADAVRRRARPGSTRSSPSARSGSSTRPRSARSPRSRRLRVFDGDALVGDMPVTALVDECPVYDLAPVAPSVSMYPAPEPVLASGLDAGGTLLALLRSANLASRRWAFEQYDCLVGSRTVRRPEQADAAVLQLPAAPRSRSRSTATAGGSPATPTAAPSRPCSSAAPTSPAWAPSRSGSRTASTSATPRSRTSPGSSRARCPASPTPAARSRSRSSAATSRSTTRRAPARSSPRRSSASSASCPRRRARAGSASREEGDVVAVISAGSWAPAATGSELAKLRGEAPWGELPAGRPRRAARAARRGPPGRARRRAALRPRRRRGRPRRRAGRGVPGRRPRRRRSTCRRCGRPARRCCSARARARSSSRARSSRCARSAAAAVRIGTVGGGPTRHRRRAGRPGRRAVGRACRRPGVAARLSAPHVNGALRGGFRGRWSPAEVTFEPRSQPPVVI